MAPSHRSQKLLRALAALMALAWCVYAVHAAFGLGEGPAYEVWLYSGLMGSAGVACLLRAALVRPERVAWALFGVGILLWSAGEVYWSLALSGAPQVPVPSAADALYLALYPLLYVGLIRLARARLGHFGSRLGLDGVIAALAVAGLAAAAALGPIFAAAEGDALAVATNAAYPLGDLVLLALVVGVTVLTGWRPGRSWLLLGAGLYLMAVADGVYLLQSSTGSYQEGTLLDLMWPSAALLVAAAAWQPSPPARHQVAGRRLTAAPVAYAALAVVTSVLNSAADANLAGKVLSSAALVAVTARMTLAFVDNRRLLDRTRRDALDDALTGLGNRRRLLIDLAAATVTAEHPRVLTLFDLNGFKRFNDIYGHPAGDQLLARLGGRLEAVAGSRGRAYRLGGDEFCVLSRSESSGALVDAASEALTERGTGFSVDAAHGAVMLPEEARDAAAALQLADRRMYANKRGGRSSSYAQTCRALGITLAESRPELQSHVEGVALLAAAVAARLGMSAEERDEVRRAAELHDLGKVALPDAILSKPGPLDDEEWRFVERHTLIAQRILSAAPALAPVGRLVRSSHERFNGTGYPDGLAGEDIPLGARVVSVCDAYEAMTSDRPYQSASSAEEAVAELCRCAGKQFDPRVVEAFRAALQDDGPAPVPGDAPA